LILQIKRRNARQDLCYLRLTYLRFFSAFFTPLTIIIARISATPSARRPVPRPPNSEIDSMDSTHLFPPIPSFPDHHNISPPWCTSSVSHLIRFAPRFLFNCRRFVSVVPPDTCNTHLFIFLTTCFVAYPSLIPQFQSPEIGPYCQIRPTKITSPCLLSLSLTSVFSYVQLSWQMSVHGRMERQLLLKEASLSLRSWTGKADCHSPSSSE
jgi:hypothetical protein